MSHSQQHIQSLISDEVSFLRDQLATCSKLLKCSLKANQPFDGHAKQKINALLERLDEALTSREEVQSQQREKFATLTQQTSELKTLATKQEAFVVHLKQQYARLSTEKSTIETKLAASEASLEGTRKQLETALADVTKAREERDLSKEQNKKLVELIQRMEKRLADKTGNEEKLEEENLQLREMTQLMSAQIDKIESDLERKMLSKDKEIKELRGQVESLLDAHSESLQAETRKANNRQADLNADLAELEELESQLN